MVDSSSSLICERKQSLFREWQEAFDTYSKIVAEMTDKVSKISESEYSKLKHNAQAFRNLTLRLRSELHDHIEMHDC